MVIRVSKPEINLREKLSQLELPVGPYGSSLMRSDDKMEAAKIVGVGRKNMIRNGNFIVNQKGTTTFSNVSSGRIFDGYYLHDSSNGSISATIAEATPYSPECSKYLEIACTGTDNNLTSGQYVSLSCAIEGYYFQQAMWGTRHGKDLTLSFYHKHTRPGVYSGCFRDAGGSDYNYIFEYTQEQADTWELAEIQVIGPTLNAWPTDNGKALNLNWSLADESHVSDNINKWFAGAYYHGSTRQINFMTSTDNRFRITAIQLEVGKGKTPFDDIGYEAMLAWCQRYYQQIVGHSDMVCVGPGRCNGTTNVPFSVPLSVPLRASPTINSCNFAAFTATNQANISNHTPAVTKWDATNNVLTLQVSGLSGMTNARAANMFLNSSHTLSMSAEL